MSQCYKPHITEYRRIENLPYYRDRDGTVYVDGPLRYRLYPQDHSAESWSVERSYERWLEERGAD